VRPPQWRRVVRIGLFAALAVVLVVGASNLFAAARDHGDAVAAHRSERRAAIGTTTTVGPATVRTVVQTGTTVPTPTPVVPTLVHGDFRNGNLLIDPEIGVAAVLDWELAHIGDPAEDMGWICTNSWRFGRPDRPVGGFGDYADLLAGYAAAGGRPIELSRVRFWQMLGSMRWGIMCLTMYLSWRDGVTKSVERPMIGRRVSETEADLVVLLEEGL
jgi:aminoglycoside phosphotransferase (APT) family kinase protein